MSEPINVLPALALRGTTILPGMIIHFDVSRERSKKAIEAGNVSGSEDLSGNPEGSPD